MPHAPTGVEGHRTAYTQRPILLDTASDIQYDAALLDKVLEHHGGPRSSAATNFIGYLGQVTVPVEKIGLVVGTGGRVLRLIEARSKCVLSVDPLESEGHLEQNVCIKSPIAADVEFAKKLVMAVLMKDTNRSVASVIDAICSSEGEDHQPLEKMQRLGPGGAAVVAAVAAAPSDAKENRTMQAVVTSTVPAKMTFFSGNGLARQATALDAAVAKDCTGTQDAAARHMGAGDGGRRAEMPKHTTSSKIIKVDEAAQGTHTLPHPVADGGRDRSLTGHVKVGRREASYLSKGEHAGYKDIYDFPAEGSYDFSQHGLMRLAQRDISLSELYGARSQSAPVVQILSGTKKQRQTLITTYRISTPKDSAVLSLRGVGTFSSTCKVAVPVEKIGLVVGTGGRVLKLIEAKSKCVVSVDPLESEGRLKQNVSIKSPIAADVEFAKKLVMDVLEKDANETTISVIEELYRAREEQMAAKALLLERAKEQKKALNIAKALALVEAKAARASMKELADATANEGKKGKKDKKVKKAKKGKKVKTGESGKKGAANN